MCIEVTDTSLGEIHHEDLLLIHHLTEIEGALGLADNIAHRGIGDERSEFRREEWDHLLFLTIACLSIFMIPEGLHHDVLDLGGLVLHESFIHEEPWHIDERTTFLLIIHECQTSIAEVMLYTRTEYLIAIHLYEYGSRVQCGTVFLDGFEGWICRDEVKHVESHRTIKICWIEDNHILCTLLGRECKDILDEIPMWIDDSESVSCPEVLTGKVSDEDRLTSSGFTDDIVVTSAVFAGEIDRCFLIAVFIPSHEHPILVEWESSEFPLFIDLNRCLPCIDRATDILSLRVDEHYCTICEDEVLILIPFQVFIGIHFEE